MTVFSNPKIPFMLLLSLLYGKVITTTSWLYPTTIPNIRTRTTTTTRTIPRILASTTTTTTNSALYYRSESSSSPEEGLTDDDSAMSRWFMSTSKKQFLVSTDEEQEFLTSSSTTTTTPATPTTPTITTTRAMIQGVSLAPCGFYVMLRLLCNGKYYIPFQITNDKQDSIAASSTEALTMIQLLSGVDMAGTVLPPDILAKLVVLYCENLLLSKKEKSIGNDNNNKNNDIDDKKTSPSNGKNKEEKEEYHVAQNILAHVQKSLPNSTVSYSEVHEWFQSRVKLPEVSLDEVTIICMANNNIHNHNDNHNDNDQTTKVETESSLPPPPPTTTRTKFILSCQIRNYGTLTFEPTQQMLQSVLYQYTLENNISSTFTALSLALRYQAPITMKLMTTTNNNDNNNSNTNNDILKNEEKENNNNNIYTMKEIETKFPMYKCRTSLQQSNIRVQENIVRSFEIHKLTGALRIARERGDIIAAEKIRLALDEYDNMDDLPTTNMSNNLNSNLLPIDTNTNTNLSENADDNSGNGDDDDDNDNDDFTLDVMQ